MTALAFNRVTSTGTRPHPYSIAGSFTAPSYTYESYGGDPRPSFTNPTPVHATAPPPTLSSAASLTGRSISGGWTRLREPLRYFTSTRSFGSVGSPRDDDNRRRHMIYARNIEPVAAVDDHGFTRSFFEGRGEVNQLSTQKTPKRTRSVIDIGLKSMRSWFSSTRDYSTQSPIVELPKSEKPYHYRKRSLRRAMSLHSSDIEEPSPDEYTFEIAKNGAGDLHTAIRAIESASYIPASPGSTNTPDRSSGSSRSLAFDDLDSVSSGSVYLPTSPPAPPVHRVLPSTGGIEHMVSQEAPQKSAFEQRDWRSTFFDDDKPPTPPLRSQGVSFSRPTPQVYSPLICQTTPRHETLEQAPSRSPTSPVRASVSSKATPAPLCAPSSPPPLPSRNPKRWPSDSGYEPLIHATLDQLFLGRGQDKLNVSTPGPSTVVLKQPVPPPSSWRQKPLTSIGKRF